MEIHGKVALVTGGAHRVGRAITLTLAAAGANVIVNYNHSATAADATVADARALGVDAIAVQCDIGDAGAVAAMAADVTARVGTPDILVNNAGIFRTTRFPVEDLVAWNEVVNTSIHGTFFVTNAFAPAMAAKPAGAIVNILDTSIYEPWRHFTAHAVGKAGMEALTRQLALELAPTVRVNAVAPGMVLPPEAYTQAQIDRAAANTLLKRVGTPEDVARAVQYLIEADFVTGTIVRVDGGERYTPRKG